MLFSPTKDGFVMPNEYDVNAKCWMIFPQADYTWRNGAQSVMSVFLDIAHKISKYDDVIVGVSNEYYKNARYALHDDIRVIELSNDDCWIQDSAPIFLINNKTREIRGVDFEYNGYGGLDDGLYSSWENDNLIAQKILEIVGLQRYKSDFVLEGGAISSDGKGTIIAIKKCLFSRNKNKTQEQIEACLKDYLGAKKIIWLEQGLLCDETKGHADNFCVFVDEGRVLLNLCDSPKNPQYDICKKAYEILQNTTDANGNALQIHTINQPPDIYMSEHELNSFPKIYRDYFKKYDYKLSANYINSYIATKCVLVPMFGFESYDKEALNVFKKIYPNKDIIGIENSKEVLLGGGNIHCITKRQPFFSI